MKSWLIAVWDSWRSSFWFTPALLTIVAVVLGIVLPVLDAHVHPQGRALVSWIQTTSSAARATLGALTGTLITVTSVIFSVTMVTLSLTTSQFGSRLLRTFSENEITQFTLGTFLGTSVYCLLVLRSVRTVEGQEFVPHISTAFGVGASILSVVLFIAFIHHVANSIQAQSVVRSVAHDLDLAIEYLYPNKLDDDDDFVDRPLGEVDPAGLFDDVSSVTVIAETDGYLQAVDVPSLRSLAERHELVIRLAVRPGDFVARGAPIAELMHRNPPQNDGADFSEPVNDLFVVGHRRTPRQDVECAVQELVEVAVRALSPGINDPFTALSCIDYLLASLRRFASRKIPSSYVYDADGNLRLILRPITFPDLLDSGLNQIRHFGAQQPAILSRLLDRLCVLAGGVRRPSDRDAVRRHAGMIMRAAEHGLPESNDVEAVRQRYERLLQLVGEAPQTQDKAPASKPNGSNPTDRP